LLREDWRNSAAGGFHRGDMSRRRHADAVAEAEAWLQTKD
jgi:hypothetical protein